MKNKLDKNNIVVAKHYVTKYTRFGLLATSLVFTFGFAWLIPLDPKLALFMIIPGIFVALTLIVWLYPKTAIVKRGNIVIFKGLFWRKKVYATGIFDIRLEQTYKDWWLYSTRYGIGRMHEFDANGVCNMIISFRDHGATNNVIMYRIEGAGCAKSYLERLIAEERAKIADNNKKK